MSTSRQASPPDVSDDEWAFVAPYLSLIAPDALQRKYDLREVDNGLRWLARTGAQWRMRPHDFPRWEAVDQQTPRWLRAGCFEAIAHDACGGRLRGGTPFACGLTRPWPRLWPPRRTITRSTHQILLPATCRARVVDRAAVGSFAGYSGGYALRLPSRLAASSTALVS